MNQQPTVGKPAGYNEILAKELLEHIHKGEFEILRSLCMGGPQATELNRLFTIMKTKYKYVK